MEAKDYSVTFKYGATTAPYSPTHPHLGEDRKMPLRTLINVNGVLVGYAGTTGVSTGVHTHTQRVYGNSVVHPQGGGFDVPQPCVVTETGLRKDIGYYVRYKDGQGFIWSIFHMDKPATVHVGQQLIKEEQVAISKERVEAVFKGYLNRTASQEEINYWTNPIRKSEELDDNAATTRFNQDAKTIADLRQQLATNSGLTPTQVDKEFKMSLLRDPTQAELNNPDYQKSAGLLIDTLWNNGGQKRYEERDQVYKEVGVIDGQKVYKKG